MAVVASQKVNAWTGTNTNFVFVIDTTTGSHVGSAVEFDHGGAPANYKMYVLNQGLLMRAGKVYTAFFSDLSENWGVKGWGGGTCQSSKKDSRMRISRYDWDTDSVAFYKESSQYGKASALLWTGMASNPLWLAGVTSLTDGPSPTWMFTLL